MTDSTRTNLFANLRFVFHVDFGELLCQPLPHMRADDSIVSIAGLLVGYWVFLFHGGTNSVTGCVAEIQYGD